MMGNARMGQCESELARGWDVCTSETAAHEPVRDGTGGQLSWRAAMMSAHPRRLHMSLCVTEWAGSLVGARHGGFAPVCRASSGA